jgi:CHAD domain-containing protein
MAFSLRPSESVSDGLRRLARAELKSARRQLHGAASPPDEAIHEARKSVKKIRAIVQLCDADDAAGMGKCLKRLRKINRELSKLRDAAAVLETLSMFQRTARSAEDRAAYDRIKRRLVSRKNAAIRAAAAGKIWNMIDRECRRLRRAARRWEPKHGSFGALAPGIRESYRAGRKALARARKRRRASDFHEWRKHVKTLWYELRLMEGASAAVDAHVATLHRLEDWLGDEHNVAVLFEKLAAEAPAGFATVRPAGVRRQTSLRRKAIERGKSAYARGTNAFVRSVERAWHASREGTPGHRDKELRSRQGGDSTQRHPGQ